jgi:formylglycine-generating enzyme required for sulfatase activity
MRIPGVVLVLLLAMAARAAESPAPLKPLPKNRPFDGYANRAEFLQHTAAFETERLRKTALRHDQEEARFAGRQFVVRIGDGLELKFVKIPRAHFTDGVTTELKEKVFSIPNRANDLRRWEKSLETDRVARVTVPYDFFMSEVIVTRAMFSAFVRQTGYRTTVSRYQTGWIVTKDAQWLQGFANEFDHQVPPLSGPEHPVVQVSWFDAMQFAAWLSAKAGVVFRLPTKDEWSLAARPVSQLDQPCLFPWGNDVSAAAARMNFGTRELDYMWVHDQFTDGHALSSPVKAFPADSRGLRDMLGNVWVWNWSNHAIYEERPRGGREAQVPALDDLKVADNAAMAMQGGCYLARLSHANLLSKMSHPALDGAEDIGFRLVAVRAAQSGIAK